MYYKLSTAMLYISSFYAVYVIMLCVYAVLCVYAIIFLVYKRCCFLSEQLGFLIKSGCKKG